jgi:exosortase
MDLERFKFWKFRGRDPSDISRRGNSLRREFGYYGGILPVRVPQLNYIDLAVIGGLMLLANAFMIISLFKFYLNFEDYSHAILIPVIAAAAAWRVLSLSESKINVSADFRGLPVLFAGLLIQFVAMWYEIGLVAGGVVSEYFTSVGLVISVWGIFISFFGVSAIKLFWFPLFYLVFMIPGLPGPPEVWLKSTLRNIVTIQSSWTLERFGYSVFVEGNVLEIPDVKLGIADACSGIRSLWAMLAVAPAAAWFLRLRPFLVALFMPLGVFLAIFQNVIRVVATALLCDWFGMSWASGTKHDVVGGVSFFLSSIIMIILARVLAPPLQKKVDTVGAYNSYGVYGGYGVSSGYGYGGGTAAAAYHADNDPEAEEGAQEFISAEKQRESFFSRISPIRVSVILLLLIMLLSQLVLFQRYAIRNRVQYEISRQRLSLDIFPGNIGKYRRTHWGELPEIALRVLKPSESYVAWYTSPDNRHVNVVINFWEPVIGFNGASWAFPHNPDLCFREAGWEIEQRVDDLPPGLEDPYEILYSRLYRNDQSRQMVLYWYNRDEVVMFMNEFIDDHDREEVALMMENFVDNEKGYFNRLRHMVRSWSRPRDYSRYQYSVGIYVPEQGTVEETIELAMDFALELRKQISPFGLKPLQNMNLENIGESLKTEQVLGSDPAIQSAVSMLDEE